jgi:hypothetical protein
MTQINLHWLITESVSSTLLSLITAIESPISVQDADGTLLIDGLNPEEERHELAVAGQTLGWVVGGKGAVAIAAFLNHVAEMQRQVDDLHVQIEVLKGSRQIHDITEDDYFQKLQRRVKPFKSIKPISRNQT